MSYLYSVKATANNKQRARIWVERDLSAFGFVRGTLLDIQIQSDRIRISADPMGKRKMAGRTKADGTEIHILDLCMPQEIRERLRAGCERFNVYAAQGEIIIQRAA